MAAANNSFNPEVLSENQVIRFLTEPTYKVHRYFTGGLFALMIAFNSGLLSHMDVSEPTSRLVLWETVITLTVYLLVVVINMRILAPRLLLKDNYAGYFCAMGLLIAVIIGVFPVIQLGLIRHYGVMPGRFSYFHHDRIMALDLATEYLTTALSMAGITTPIMLRQWIRYGKKRTAWNKPVSNQKRNNLKAG